jgi:hypothetical protein
VALPFKQTDDLSLTSVLKTQIEADNRRRRVGLHVELVGLDRKQRE